jgi:phosphate transport system permease protein
MDLYRRRIVVNRVGLALSMAAMLIGLGALVWILGTLMFKGLGALRPHVFTQMTPPPGNDGGLLNAIYGSLLMVGVGTLIAMPTGILAGIYLAEYGQRSWLAPVTRFVNDILLSAPSIVLGLFVYAVYVANVGHFSGWAGALALALIAVPVIVRATDNMLSLVPNSLREAAAALGAPRWKVIMLVTLRAARAGVITGIVLDAPGSGYVAVPDVVIVDPTGTGARAVARMELDRVDVRSPGRGYTLGATIFFTPFFKAAFPDAADQSRPFFGFMNGLLRDRVITPILTHTPVLS